MLGFIMRSSLLETKYVCVGSVCYGIGTHVEADVPTGGAHPPPPKWTNVTGGTFTNGTGVCKHLCGRICEACWIQVVKKVIHNPYRYSLFPHSPKGKGFLRGRKN